MLRSFKGDPPRRSDCHVSTFGRSEWAPRIREGAWPEAGPQSGVAAARQRVKQARRAPGYISQWRYLCKK